MLCESLLFLQGPWSECEFCYLHSVIGGQKEAGPWTCWVFIRKKIFALFPLHSFPSPSFFSLDRVQDFSVQMEHLDSFSVESLWITSYLWRFMVIDGHSCSWYFSVFAALFYFLRDCQECCRGDWPWIWSLIWKRPSIYFVTIQHHSWLLSSACSQTKL